MHDRNGTPLKKGDKVLVECEVHEIYAAEDYCNLTLKTMHGRRPDGLKKETISAINTGVVVLLEQAKP